MLQDFMAFFAVVGTFVAICLAGSEVEFIVLAARAFH